MLNGGKRTPWNCNTIQRDPAWRKGKDPHCALSMSPVDAARLGIADGARVRLETRRGAVELPVSLDDTLRAGHLAVPNGFGSGIRTRPASSCRRASPSTSSPTRPTATRSPGARTTRRCAAACTRSREPGRPSA